jgi:hypothetical protein
MLKRIQSRGTRGDIIKSLAELIKNSDDAYERLEAKGEEVSGLIEIGYKKLKKKDGYRISGFYVRDFGSGMNMEKVQCAYGTQGYGEDTSDDTTNGAIGVGGKDAFYNMENCNIITSQNNSSIAITLETTDQGIGAEIFDGDDVQPLIQKINSIIGQYSTPLDSSDRGTFAMFSIPENHSGTRTDKLQEHLTSYYTLRNILQKKNRKVKLIDIDTGKNIILNYREPDGDVIYENTFKIPHLDEKFKIDVVLKKSKNDLEHNKDYGTSILIRDNKGAVLDNTMFDYEKDPASNRFFGNIVIHNWKYLYRELDSTVLTDNREGLDYNNEFNRIMKKQLVAILRPMIDKEREQQGENPKLQKNLQQNIDKTFAYINKIMEKDPDEGFEEGDEIEVPPEGIEFEKGSLTIPPNKKKKVKLFVNPGKVQSSEEIKLERFGDGSLINPIGSIFTPNDYAQYTVPYVVIEIEGQKINSRTTLKAYYQDLTAEIEIYVKAEETFYPINGFAFVSRTVALSKNKKKRIKLVLDTNLINAGTEIEIQSNDERLKIDPQKLTVSKPPTLGKYLTEEIIEISCNTKDITAQITASTTTTMGEPREAICKVKVVDKEPPKQFFKGFDLDRKGDPRQRSRFQEGTVYVHVNAPVLKIYFGFQEKKLNEKNDDAVAMLADTVVQRVAIEWAKWRIDKDKEDMLGDYHSELERIKNRLEYEHGSALHQLIKFGYERKQEE